MDFWLCIDAHERYIDWETLFNNFDILYKESKLLNTVSQSQTQDPSVFNTSIVIYQNNVLS